MIVEIIKHTLLQVSMDFLHSPNFRWHAATFRCSKFFNNESEREVERFSLNLNQPDKLKLAKYASFL